MKFIHGKLVFCPKSTSLSGMENFTGKERYFDATIIKMIVSNKKTIDYFLYTLCFFSKYNLLICRMSYYNFLIVYK